MAAAAGLRYRHVDVFSERPYAGNGLIVVFGATEAPSERLLAITRELRQFETVFVGLDPDRDPDPGAGAIAARIFTTEEELPFAGHPVIGAAAALHELIAGAAAERSWTFEIAGRAIEVVSRPNGGYYAAEMNQGPATLSAPLSGAPVTRLVAALGLGTEDLHNLPLRVASTGLPYLIVPVRAAALAVARVAVDDLGTRLAEIGAKFVYVLDPDRREGRTWDNAGAVEDVATGSAAGPAAAYLIEHGLADPATEIALRQGRFVARPSTILARRRDGALWVGGPVAAVARGRLDPS